MKKEKDPQIRLDICVQHWSGCMGGFFIKEPVADLEVFLRDQETANPWLANFLQDIPTGALKAEIIECSKNGKNEYPVGPFLAKVKFHQFQLDNRYLWAVALSADGAQAFPIKGQKRKEAVGSDSLRGYKINASKLDSSIVFSYLMDSDGLLKEMMFRHQGGLIAANLYQLDGDISKEDWASLDLKNKRPFRSSVIAYKIPRQCF
ncbi:hypothetical protein KKE03_01025 [Patescibacteria group bacterium]|nr:hypothetical protein [Patescibacteria group bacterium]